MDGCGAPKGLGAPKGTVCHGVLKAAHDVIHRQLQRLEPDNMQTETIHATDGGIEAIRCCRRRCRFITMGQVFSCALTSTIPGESTEKLIPLSYIGFVRSKIAARGHRHRRQIFIHVCRCVHVHLHVSDLLDWAVPKQLPFNTLNHTSLQISQTSCSRRNLLLL